MDNPALNSLVKPYIEGMPDPISVLPKSVRNKEKEEALAIRDNIKTELENKLISLKADCCTRIGRSVIGIKVQFISDAKIVVL